MLFKLVILLTTVPLVELYFLVKLSQWTSFSTTVLVIIGTGILGGFLARMEGLRVLENIRKEVEAGHLPHDSLVEGAMILLAGALLLTPGLLTDGLGFLVLIPFTRKHLIVLCKRQIRRMMDHGQVEIHKRMGFGPINENPPPGAPPLEDEEDDLES
jgi:UPF0716 protein FxsA